MKHKLTILIVGSFLLGSFLITRLLASEAPPKAKHEYLTIRWAGVGDTHIVRPGGKVEFIGPKLRKAERPDRVDDRTFYLNIAINELAKEGFELAVINHDEVVMKRESK